MRLFHMVLLGMPAIAAAAGAGAADPEAFVSLRGVMDEAIEVGEPLFVGARFEAPFESKAPVDLAPDSGTWADGVEILLARGDVALPLRGTAAFTPSRTGVSLDKDGAATGEWYLSQAQTARLEPGDYTVRVRLTIGSGTGWTGSITSEAQTIRVIAPGTTPERVLQRTVALAYEALAGDRLEDGVRIVDTLLTDQPDNLRLLTIRARLCARAGDLVGAMTCVVRALSTAEVEALSHPPIGLFELHEEIGAAMDTPAGRTSAAPGWTRLPPRVLEIIRPSSTPRAATVPPVATLPAINPPAVGTTPVATIPDTPAAAPLATGTPPVGTVVPATELDEAKILGDARGQWVASAQAKSEYSSPNYGAVQLVGPPDVPDGNDNVRAWCHHTLAKGLEWIELTYAKPVQATEVRVRQTYNPGAIVKIEAIDTEGQTHLWWGGVDPARPPGALNAIAWFAVRVPKTEYRVARIRVTLDLDAVMSWQEIDAVQLVGDAP